MDLKTQYLKKLKNEKIFVDFYTDNYNESFYGFIIDFNDDFLLIETYNDNLIFNGIVVFRQQDITRIKWDKNDLKNSYEIIKNNRKKLDLKGIKIDSIQNILKTVYSKFNHFSIFIQDIDNEMVIIGELEQIDDEYVVIKEFGTRESNSRGFTIISLSDITKVEAGGIYEKTILETYTRLNLK